MPGNSSLKSRNIWNSPKYSLSRSDFKKKKVPRGSSNINPKLQIGSLLLSDNHNWSWSTNISKPPPNTSSSSQQNLRLTGAPSCSNHLTMNMKSVSDTSAGLNNIARLSARDYTETSISSNVIKIHSAVLHFSCVKRTLIGTLSNFSLLIRFKI